MDQKTFEIINKIASEHCHKTFGYLDEDDLKNEIWVICLEQIKEFTFDRGELEHFLRVTVKNRLINRFKELTKNVRSPCPRCEFFRPGQEPDCAKFGEQKDGCNKWVLYKISIDSRNSLLNASESTAERKIESGVLDKISNEEIRQKIRARLPKEYIHDFDRIIIGASVNRKRIKEVSGLVLTIASDLGVI